MKSDVRDAFHSASSGFAEVVSRIPPEAWARPALGVWDVRSLVGHAGRALSTIETYLEETSAGPEVGGPVDYYLRALRGDADPESRAAIG